MTSTRGTTIVWYGALNADIAWLVRLRWYSYHGIGQISKTIRISNHFWLQLLQFYHDILHTPVLNPPASNSETIRMPFSMLSLQLFLNIALSCLKMWFAKRLFGSPRFPPCCWPLCSPENAPTILPQLHGRCQSTEITFYDIFATTVWRNISVARTLKHHPVTNWTKHRITENANCVRTTVRWQRFFTSSQPQFAGYKGFHGVWPCHNELLKLK